MELRIAEQHDVPRIMELINQAKALLKSRGVNQWQDGYPDQACIEGDVRNGTGWLCVQDGEMVGYLCAEFGGEPAYDHLNGSWLSIQPYAAVHRLAFDGTARGKGLSSPVFRLVEDLCRERNVHSIKIDTDEGNAVMKHILAKNGFQYCGTVNFQNSEKIAYEKLI